MSEVPPEADPQAPSRAGLVAVIGAPNAGKSTLVNALVGQKVAIVSPKPQTTRARLLGVAMQGESQIVLTDTPGIFEGKRRLDRAMVAAAWTGIAEADIIALVVDGRTRSGGRLDDIIAGLEGRPEPVWLIVNKVDAAQKDKLLPLVEQLTARLAFAEVRFVSALNGEGVPELRAEWAQAMPEGPWLFPPDQVSDATDRALAAEVTREQLYLQLSEELPYASAVDTESYRERPDGSVEIHQQILVERPTQRAIVLGKGGQRIRSIGAAARAELSRILGVPVHLFLHVKVKENWDEDRSLYRDIGLDWVE